MHTSPAPLLSDGAMGTQLNAQGISFNQCFDALNRGQPDLVTKVHRAYIEAGADIIQTNTFGANHYKLSAYGLETQVAAINQTGVELARKSASLHNAMPDTDREVLVAGDVGPLGVRLAPFGRVQPDQAREVFHEQIAALA